MEEAKKELIRDCDMVWARQRRRDSREDRLGSREGRNDKENE
jgi:hypothetical protein